MEACRSELSLGQADLTATLITVAEFNGEVVGVAQLATVSRDAELLKLFVEPRAMHQGVGSLLFQWASRMARETGAERLLIEADPEAAPFYRRMGASDIGLAQSESIPGRMLPKLALELGPPR